MIYLLALLLALAVIIVGIVRFKIHPFFVLLLAAIGYGFLTGMSVTDILTSINEGFGGLMGKIGLIIFFGVVIGTVLEKSGGAMVIASWILKMVGERFVHLALMLTGYLLSVPVFVDSAFIMMNSLNKTLSHKAKVAFSGTSVALGLGLMATHVMVPPTPGPIAAAALLEVNLGSLILWGLLVSLLALIPSYFFATRIASRVKLTIVLEKLSESGHAPQLATSLLSIVIPILLIIANSVFDYPDLELKSHAIYPFVAFIGTPIIALLIGAALTLLLPKKLDYTVFSATGWFGDALKVAAPILLITGAGGIFGKMLQNSGIAEAITENFADLNIGLLFPFLLAASLKIAQGSSTVALITTASIMAPIMVVLGLDEPFTRTLTVLAIGAGSVVVSHANDSFFWVFTQLTGMNVKQGNQTLTLGTLVLGVSAILTIFALSQLL